MVKVLVISGRTFPADSYLSLVTSDVKNHQNFFTPQSAIRLTPDPDVVMDLSGERGRCVHARKLEETVRCDGRASEKSPNGFLCYHHQKDLNPPKVEVKVFTYKPRIDPQLDAYKALPLFEKEVKDARASLADNEIHDVRRFDRLKRVQVEEAIVRRFMERSQQE